MNNEMKQNFSYVYENDIWGGSGGGSDYSLLGDFFAWLNAFIKEKKIKSVLDYGCGLNPIGQVLSVENYTGVDIVDSVVKHCNQNYPNLNIKVNEGHPVDDADMLIVKDVLMHWEVEYINSFLKYSITKYKYVLIVNSCLQSVDNPTQNIKPHLYAMGLSYKFEPLKNFNPQLIMRIEKNPNDPKEVLLIENKI